MLCVHTCFGNICTDVACHACASPKHFHLNPWFISLCMHLKMQGRVGWDTNKAVGSNFLPAQMYYVPALGDVNETGHAVLKTNAMIFSGVSQCRGTTSRWNMQTICERHFTLVRQMRKVWVERNFVDCIFSHLCFAMFFDVACFLSRMFSCDEFSLCSCFILICFVCVCELYMTIWIRYVCLCWITPCYAGCGVRAMPLCEGQGRFTNLRSHRIEILNRNVNR